MLERPSQEHVSVYAGFGSPWQLDCTHRSYFGFAALGAKIDATPIILHLRGLAESRSGTRLLTLIVRLRCYFAIHLRDLPRSALVRMLQTRNMLTSLL